MKFAQILPLVSRRWARVKGAGQFPPALGLATPSALRNATLQPSPADIMVATNFRKQRPAREFRGVPVHAAVLGVDCVRRSVARRLALSSTPRETNSWRPFGLQHLLNSLEETSPCSGISMGLGVGVRRINVTKFRTVVSEARRVGASAT